MLTDMRRSGVYTNSLPVHDMLVYWDTLADMSYIWTLLHVKYMDLGLSVLFLLNICIHIYTQSI